MRSNLHNVLFAPKSTQFWVSHATIDGQPAAGQPYHKFQLTELLARKPDADADVIPLHVDPKPAVETARSVKDAVSNERLKTK